MGKSRLVMQGLVTALCTIPSPLLQADEVGVSPTPNADTPPVQLTPETESSATKVSPTAQLVGHVREAGNRQPIEGVELRTSQQEAETYSEPDGSFQLDNVPSGACTLTLTAPGYEPRSVPLLLQAGQRLNLELYLVPRPGRGYAMTVETRKAGETQVQYELDADQASKVPGSLGDPVRTVQNLPGVARAPYGLGALIIRGTAPYESGYFLDDAEVPLLFHFLGLTSAVGAELVEQIDYLPGGFGVRNGRLVGGLVQLRLVDELPPGIHGHADIDMLDGSLHVQGSAGRVSYMAAARTSYLEGIVGPLSEDVLHYPVRAAHFADIQLRLMAQLSDRTRAGLTWMRSEDRFLLLGQTSSNGAEEVDPEALAEYQSDFSRLQFRLQTRFNSGAGVGNGKGLTHTLTLAAGPNHELLNYGATRLEYFPQTVTVRDEWSQGLSTRLFVRGGLDFQATAHRFTIDLPGSDSDIPEEQSGLSYAPALYLETEWQGSNGMRVQPGLRLDAYWTPSQNFYAMSLDPRLTLTQPLALNALAWGTEGESRHQSLELSFSLGNYSQPPDATDYFAVYGNNSLQPYHAIQVALGGRYRLEPGWEARLNLFYSALQNLVYRPRIEPIPIEDYVLGTVDTSASIPLPQNGGIGRSFGTELLLQTPTLERWMGWLSLSLSRSQRKNPGDLAWSLFDYDQPIVLSLLSSYQLRHGWQVGGRFRLSSGAPYTAVSNRLQNLDTGGYSPLEDPTEGANNARMPLFHSLDLRVDKTWRFDTWKLLLSLEIQNLYNHQNVELVYPNRDYSDVVPIYGLPILPVLGIRGEF